MGAAKPKAKGGAKLVCPKKVKVGAREMKVSSSGGHCHVKRTDGSKAAVRKVARGHKGYGTFAKSGGKKKAGRASRRELENRVNELTHALARYEARAAQASAKWSADPGARW